ncbi:MAG: SulP family inorganic anion transporter, partial [Gammaproteobacteria bacterium]|nr:SulP family inorganic anion transporter [Gammaproteobacteria bacterium]
LIVGTAVYINLMADSGAPIIGDIPTGLPDLVMPTFMLEYLPDMIKSALILAALGAIDSLLTSLVADNITRTYHKSDRELIGQGIGNTVSGFFGGLPGAGATMRTVVNVKAGGRTPISGALHAVVLLAIVLGAGSLASDIPKAVLAGILIKVGTDIIDWDYLKRIKAAPKPGVLIMTVVLVTTVAVDLLLAVGIGMVMASFIFMQRMANLQMDSVTATKNTEEMPLNAEEKELMDAAEGRIMLFHISGPMGFSAAKAMARRHAGIADYDIMLLDLSDVPMIDFTSARAVEDIIMDTKDAGRQVFLVGAGQKVCDMLKKQKVLRHIDASQMYQQRTDALLHASNLLKDTK